MADKVVINFADCEYKILRDTGWNHPSKVIASQTRSGASKRRIGHTASVPVFDVTMQFPTAEDYEKFCEWYENKDLNGFYPFWLSKIDRVKGRPYAYRFSGEWNGKNTAGHVVSVSFSLEELFEYKE